MGKFMITRNINGVMTDIELTSSEVMDIYEKKDMDMYAADLESEFGNEFTEEEYREGAWELRSLIFDDGGYAFVEALKEVRKIMLRWRTEGK